MRLHSANRSGPWGNVTYSNSCPISGFRFIQFCGPGVWGLFILDFLFVYNEKRQAMYYNVTLWRVRVTIVAVGKQ
jgi:hypothetical protein